MMMGVEDSNGDPPLTRSTSPHNCELRFESSGDYFACVFAPCKVLDAHLAAALRKPQLNINSTW